MDAATLAVHCLLGLIAGWGAMSLRSFVQNFRAGLKAVDPVCIPRRWQLFAAFFVPIMLALLCWWTGEWPGHWKTDEAYLFQQAQKGVTEPWLSAGFSVYAILVLRTLGNYTLISLVNCIVIAAVIADVLSLLVHAGLKRWIAAVLLVLACTSVPLGLLATSLSHDLVSAAIRLCLVAIVVRCVVRNTVAGSAAPTLATTVFTQVHVVVLVIFATALRGENIVLVVSMPIVLWLSGAVRASKAALLIAVLSLGAFLLKGPLTQGLSRPDPDRESRYALTLVINPLSYYVANNYWTPTPTEDAQVLATVVDIDDLRTLHTPYDIQTYWIGASKGDVTPAEMRKVKELFVRATLDNPGLFLSSRAATVSGMLGMTSRSNLWFYDHREARPLSKYAESNPPMQRAFDAGYKWRETPSIIGRATHALRDWSVPRGWKTPGHWIWNAWPSLLVMIAALAMARRTPKTALVACVIAGPFALVALAAPASHFKYIYDVYAIGFLLPAVWAWEWSGRKRVWDEGIRSSWRLTP
ncbi:MAG TPA: hypothetical protein VHN77_00150 [Phycisphaerales bacterium]|nr:hypothetical protein [Phycisphaerales bacterium]